MEELIYVADPSDTPEGVYLPNPGLLSPMSEGYSRKQLHWLTEAFRALLEDQYSSRVLPRISTRYPSPRK